MQAFVLRIAPSEVDHVEEALKSNQLIIGWARAEGLLDRNLEWLEFRERIRGPYYANEPNLRRVGSAAGHMWRFIRAMEPGDLVVVPAGSGFYVAKVSGEASYLPEFVERDAAYRRPVEWLNNKKPIPRSFARSALISRMKIKGTSANASDLIPEINDALSQAASGKSPSFQSDLVSSLAKEALSELRRGRLDPFAFEQLISDLMLAMGASTSRVIPRRLDKGADIVSTFRVAGIFPFTIAIQAKHWQVDPPVDAAVVEQLVRGIDAESADMGMVVTTGTYDRSALEFAKNYSDDSGKAIELVDGEQFSKMLIEFGLHKARTV